MSLGKSLASDLDSGRAAAGHDTEFDVRDSNRLCGESVASECLPGWVPCNPAAIYALIPRGEYSLRRI